MQAARQEGSDSAPWMGSGPGSRGCTSSGRRLAARLSDLCTRCSGGEGETQARGEHLRPKKSLAYTRCRRFRQPWKFCGKAVAPGDMLRAARETYGPPFSGIGSRQHLFSPHPHFPERTTQNWRDNRRYLTTPESRRCSLQVFHGQPHSLLLDAFRICWRPSSRVNTIRIHQAENVAPSPCGKLKERGRDIPRWISCLNRRNNDQEHTPSAS
ncbi:hypothetical protein GE09DRAFT_721619 [Coniochaeta sp. 2T2.1]|nr:hypothetical protein GE09DRAFT_721619 [Coniochaeta sp. 2T2.1]